MKGLLITHWFPPKNSIASFRTHAIAKYLNEYGFELEVICPDWNGDLKLSSDFKIHHSHKIEDNIRYGYYPNRLKGFLVKNILYKYFKYNLFRDLKKGLFYAKGKAIIEMLDIHKYQFVISSYGPLDVIYLGDFIKTKYPHITWLIDYRDYFSLFHYNDYGIFQKLFELFEKRVTRKCDAFVTVSKQLCINQEKLLNKKGFVCYNGFDDYNLVESKLFVEELKQMTLPIIAHAGSLYRGQRNVGPFFEYFSKNKLDEVFNLVFAVIDDDDEIYLRKIQEKFNLKNLKIYRNLSFNDSLSLQNLSRYLLLLVNTDGTGNGYLTGKFYEYIKIGKQIIYSGSTHNYELYDMIKEYRLGEHYQKFNYFNTKDKQSDKVKMFHRREQIFNLASFIKKLCKQ